MARPVAMRRNTPHNNATQSGAAPGGTMGGRPNARVGRRPGAYPVNIGDQMYLWILVVVEALLIGVLRRNFRRHHGG